MSIRRRVRLGITMWLAACALVTCSNPTDVAEPDTTRVPAPVTFVQLHAPATTLVNESTLLDVTAYTSTGTVPANPSDVVWSTDNPWVARVSPQGVLTSLHRGTVNVTVRVGTVSASVALAVRARLRVAVDYANPYAAWFVNTGDSLHLSTWYVDVDGRPIDDVPMVQWTSSDPDLVSVDANGLVVGRAYAAMDRPIRIAAEATDDTLINNVYVADDVAGLPATLRLAHAVRGVDSLTFIPSRGAPVTLAFGESIDLPIQSGMFTVLVDGPAVADPWHAGAKAGGFRALIRSGESPALYAVGTDTAAYFVLSSTRAPGMVDSSLAFVRLIQVDGPPVIFVRSRGETVLGLADLCYFDPSDQAIIMHAPGDIDIIGASKFGAAESSARLPVTAPAGRQTTIVLFGPSVETFRLLVFPDP